jgi:hypothetical protein
MPSADRRHLAFAFATMIVGCAVQHQPPIPRRVPFNPPPQGDSLIREGPLAGRILMLACSNLGYIEVGDLARCVLNVGVVKDNGTSFTMLDSVPVLAVSNAAILEPARNTIRARAPGYSDVWATFQGARAIQPVGVGQRQGEVLLEPAVAETTLVVGQRYHFRFAQFDTLGREEPVTRQVGISYARWDDPGTLDTLSLGEFEFVARAPGKMQFDMARGRRVAHLTVKVIEAPKPVLSEPKVPPQPNRELRPKAQVDVQVADSVANAAAEYVLSVGGRLVRTDTTGRYRGMVDEGDIIIRVYCAVPARPMGREIGTMSTRLTEGRNPPDIVPASSAKCGFAPPQTVTGAFVGRYRNGTPDETFTACEPFQPAGSAYGDSLRIASVSIVAPSYVPKPLNDTTTYFARFVGTLTGPGSYGANGGALFYLRVSKVITLRPASPHDCRSSRK